MAIVLGAALALWAVGMEPADTGRKGKAWRRPAAAALTAVTLTLAIPLSLWLYASLPHRPVPTGVYDALAARVAAQPDATLTEVSVSDGRRRPAVLRRVPRRRRAARARASRPISPSSYDATTTAPAACG